MHFFKKIKGLTGKYIAKIRTITSVDGKALREICRNKTELARICGKAILKRQKI